MQYREARFYWVFFVAGLPALIYQVVWQRVLTLYFGVDIYSTAVTVSTFMLGLGVGAWLGGRWADRMRRPALYYAAAELLLALFGFASIPLFATVGQTLAAGPLSVTIAANFLLLLLPTFLMGMTLPLMCRVVVAREHAIGRHLAWLYGVNTLGAAVGALGCAYFLIGWLGLDGAARAAAALNIFVGLTVLFLAARQPAIETVADQESPAAPPTETAGETPGPAYGEVLLFSFLSGFLALGYEVIWYRVLGCILHGTVYVFGTILFFYLIGIAIGSLLARRRIDTGNNLWRFAWCQLGISAYVCLFFWLLGHFSWLPGLKHLLAATLFTSFHPAPELVTGRFDLASLYSLLDTFLWPIALLMFPAILMGYGFPNLMRAGSRRMERLGRSVGGVYFANVFGSTAGSLAVGFLGVHYLGSEHTLRVLIVLGCLLALWSLWRAGRTERAANSARPRSKGGTRRGLAAAAGILTLALLFFPGRTEILRAIHFADFPGVAFIAREDRSGIVALRRQDRVLVFPEEEKILHAWRLHIDGSAHGSFPGDATQFVPDEGAALGLAAHPAPRRVLLIGLGDGMMAAAAVLNPRVEELVIVELNSALRAALAQSVQKQLFDSRKVTYCLDDGRRWLLAHPEQRFDFILMFPLHAAHAYSGNLFSHEFFELLKARLRPGGIVFCRTVDPYSTARTLAEVFPHLLRLDDIFYIAGREPLRFDPDFLPIPAEELPGRIRADRAMILAETRDAPINRDFRPNSEYYVTYPYAAHLGTRLRVPVYRAPNTDYFAELAGYRETTGKTTSELE